MLVFIEQPVYKAMMKNKQRQVQIAKEETESPDRLCTDNLEQEVEEVFVLPM